MPSGQTAYELVKSSLRLIGATSVGETPTADEANDALNRANDVLELWNTERQAVYATDNQVFTLTGGQALYTIGPGGNFNTVRPAYIDGGFTTVSLCDYPFTVIGESDYNDISVKSSGSDITKVLCYLNSFPLGLIKIWPVPASSTTISLDTSTAIARIPDLQTTLAFPPGAYMALNYTLALLLAPEYGVEPSTLVAAGATKAMGDYKRSNRVRRTLKFDSALTDGSDCYAGLTSYVQGGTPPTPPPGGTPVGTFTSVVLS